MNDFSIIIPLKKDINGTLTGIASTNSVDRDDEKMSDKALKQMVTDIKSIGVNLFGNHEHNWENTLGVINNAELIDKNVVVGITLDDASTNPKVPMLLNKLKKGIKLGLSVGGNVTGYNWEYDRSLGKKIKVLDNVKIYEVSVVGIPSNADSYLSIGQAIAKSSKLNKEVVYTCDVCGETFGYERALADHVDDEHPNEDWRDMVKTCNTCVNCSTKTNKGVCPICLTKL